MRAALITVAALGALVSCREVNVAAVDVFRVEIDPPAVTIEMGASVRFTATVRDEQGRVLIRTVDWTSDAPAVLQISESGEAIARGLGSARVTARVEGRSSSADVTVRPRPVASVEVVPSAASIEVGETVALQAVARDTDGAILSNRAPIWITNNPGVVSVGADGRAIGVGAGTTTVEADVDGVRGVATISVRAVVVLPVAAVRVDPAAATVFLGDSLQLRAVVTAGDGSVLNGRPVAWSSGAPAVAFVDGGGKLRALTLGTAVITAASEGVSGQGVVTVAPVPVASVEVTPATSTVFVGATTQLQATLRAANGIVLTGRPVTWSSSNSQVAVVDATGLVTGLSAGAVTVTAASGNATGTATVVVAAMPVANVEIVPTAPSISLGGQTVLRAKLTASDGSELTGRTVVWTSSDPAVATVTSNGPTAQAATLVGLAGGTTLITAVSEGKSDTTTVTVTLKPVASVTLVPGSVILLEGATAQLLAELRDSDGTLLTDRPVDWTVADPAVAAVVGTGPPFLLTAVITAGTCPTGQSTCSTTVTATAEGIQGTATVSVRKPVSTVAVVPASDTLSVSDTQAFSALVQAADGTVLADRTVSWTASPAAQLSVVPTGAFGQSANVTANSCPAGTTGCLATLTATVGGVSGAAAVTITRTVTLVSVTPAADTVAEGGQAAFQATAQASDGSVLTDRKATWSSAGAPVSISTSGAFDHDAVVQAGTCPAGTPGKCTATLTVTIDGVQGTATLLVITPVASIQIAPAADTVFEGGSATYQATPKTANGDPIPDRLVTWSSSDPAVAVAVPNGAFGHAATVTATASCPSGPRCTAKITASSGGKQATAEFVVLRPVAAITVAPATDTLFEGATLNLTATVVTAATDTLKDRPVSWVATGQAAVVGTGQNMLTATVTAGTCPQGSSSCSAMITAEVEGKTFDVTLLVRKAVKTVTVQLAADTLYEGGTTTATARVLADDGTVLTDRLVSWSATGPATPTPASAPATANVKALQCTFGAEDCLSSIVATVDGVQGQSALTILKPVTRVQIVPSGTVFLPLSTSRTFRALLLGADGTVITKRGNAVQWTVKKSNVVTLDVTTGAQVTATGVKAGRTDIQASFTENGRPVVVGAVDVIVG